MYAKEDFFLQGSVVGFGSAVSYGCVFSHFSGRYAGRTCYAPLGRKVMTRVNEKCTCENHPNHCANIPRLNRISGQIEGIKKMITEERYCPEIISQLRAVRAALKSVESNILQAHLQNCVAQSFSSEKDRNEKIEELKNLFIKYDD